MVHLRELELALVDPAAEVLVGVWVLLAPVAGGGARRGPLPFRPGVVSNRGGSNRRAKLPVVLWVAQEPGVAEREQGLDARAARASEPTGSAGVGEPTGSAPEWAMLVQW